MQETVHIRKAISADVPEIIRLFASDMLGKMREKTSPENYPSYQRAFSLIDNDSNQFLAVAEINGKVIGTLQLTYLANMSFQGASRALVEGVHVDAALRGQGIGQFMMEWAINQAKERGCRFIQLTSNKQRIDAHRFYQRLGFNTSHEGFKMDLDKI